MTISNLITVAEYARYLLLHNEKPAPAHWHDQVKCPRCPVVVISASEAEEYASAQGGRLITEIEWTEHFSEFSELGMMEITTSPEGIIIRGGSWDDDPAFSRPTNRYHYDGSWLYVGFRVVTE